MPRGIPNKLSSAASHHPVLKSGTVNSEDEEIGQLGARTLKSTGAASDALDRPVVGDGIVSQKAKLDPEKAAMLAFFEEPVTVQIHTTSDKTAEQVFEIFNNGLREVFKRGETKTVKRKFVNELAMRKVTVYENEEVRAADGTKQYKYTPRSGLRYPFSVTRDDNPKGADWLRFTLSMAG
jgi:hypothetical protein